MPPRRNPFPPGGDLERKRKRFNQLIGGTSGTPSRRNRYAEQPEISRRRTRESQGTGRRSRTTYLSQGGGKVKEASRKSHATWTGGSADPVAAANKVFNEIYDRQTSELNQQSRDQIAARTAYVADALDEDVDPTTGQPLKEVETNAAKQTFIEEMMAKDPGRSKESAEGLWNLGNTSEVGDYWNEKFQKYILEPASRGGAAVAGGLIGVVGSALENQDKKKSEWQDFVEGAQAGWEGIKGGLTNQHKMGIGDLYELGKEKGKDPITGFTRWLEDKAPFVEQQFARAVGGVGDIAMDPFGGVTGGARTGVIAGERATAESMRVFARNLAEKWAADAETNIITGATKAPGGYRVFPTEQAMADHFEQAILKVIEAGELGINRGGSRGRYGVLNRKYTASLAGNHGAKSLQDSLTGLFTDRVQRLVDGIQGRGTKLNGAALDQWASLNPDFTDFLDDLTSELAGLGRIPPGASRDILAANLTGSEIKTIRRVEQELIDSRYTPYLQDAADSIAREFKNSYYDTPGIRIGNKVVPFKGVGRAYANLMDARFPDVGKAFSYNSMFPGQLALDTTKHRAWGVKATEDFEDEIRNNAHGISKEEGIDIQAAIENNDVGSLDAKLQAAANWIKDQYRWMYDDEFIWGARGRLRGSKPNVDSSTTPYDPNYAYVSNKGGPNTRRKEFKDDRKREIHKNVRDKNNKGAGRFKTANAKTDNLKPVENAFEALRQRRIKYNRDMIRARFRADMLDKYGLQTRLSPAGQSYAASKRGLKKVEFHQLPESVRGTIEHSGEDIYIPKEMKEMIDTFDEITKWNSAAQGRIQRGLSKIMRLIKKSMTLVWPGFHSKNMIGDVFMGLLDSIYPQDYARVLRLGAAATQGQSKGIFRILKKNNALDLTFREMWRKYQKDANSGFIISELGTLENPARYHLPTRVASRLGEAAQDVSGFREDIGRFTHYTAAYKQEAQALWNKGMRDTDKIDQMASSAALWRVNNYKFDYNALMLWEKQAKTLYFPFYTFMRKAAPTLVQAMYQDPRWINQWTRYLYNRSAGGNFPEGAGEFDGFRVPQDIRDIGFGIIGGSEEEPKYVTNDILPTSVFNSIRTDSLGGFANSVINQLALPYQVAIEQGTGRSTYLDKPLKDESTWDYLLNKLPGSRELNQFFDSEVPWSEKVTTGNLFDPNTSWLDRLTTSRIGAGLPIKDLKENQQLYAERERHDQYVSGPIDKFNKSQDLFYISTQYPPGKPATFVVMDKRQVDSQGQGQVVFQSYSPEDAIKFAKDNVPDDYRKTQKTYDIDNRGFPVYRPVQE